MYFFRQHKILYRFVSAVLAVSLVVYCLGFYSVQAAEISSLPADIDITVDYDSDSVDWTYSGSDYTFSRDYPLSVEVDGKTMYFDSVYTEYADSAYFRVSDYKTTDFAEPTVESFNGLRYNASYWFSPSENSLYILRTQASGSDIAKNAGFVRSYSVDASGHGQFALWTQGANTWYHFCVYRYDLNTDSMAIGDYTVNVSRSTTLSTVSSFWQFDLSGGFTLYSASDSRDVYRLDDNTRIQSYFPADLLCLYSTYAISGHYEPDTSRVETPDYYFNYQYIFYRKDKGYTFIDSAQPLTEVTAQGSYAYLTFADNCNKYIYTSVDGRDWKTLTTISSMYELSFTNLAYDWLYDKVTVGAVNQYDAELVHTNDDKFGVSIKEWNSLYDVIGDLPELHGSDYSDDRVVEENFAEDGLITNVFKDVKGITEYIFGIYSGNTSLISQGLRDFGGSRADEVVKTFFATTADDILMQSLLGDTVTQIIDKDGVYTRVTVDSLRSLIKGIHSLTQDTNTLLSMLHNDFVGVNDNLSILYDYSVKEAESYKTIISKLSNIEKFDAVYDQFSKDMNSGFWLVISEISGFRKSLDYLPGSLDQIRQAISGIDLSVEFPASEPGFDLFYDNPDSNEDLIDFVSEYAKTALDKSYFASFLTFDNDTTSAVRFYNGLSEDTFKALGPLGAVLLVSVGFTLVGAAIRKT